MTSLHAKLAFAAVGIAMLATPAFAQKPMHSSRQHYQYQDPQQEALGRTPYPNGSLASGSADAVEDGAQFNGGY